MKYFNPMPKTLEELKKFYRTLSFKYHPDVGGSDEIMKIINDEYTELFKMLKNMLINSKGDKYRMEFDETPEQFIEMMSQFTKAQKWIDSAENDLASAEYLAQSADRAPAGTAYKYCNRAAGKYLKVLIILKLKIPPKTHNLLKLIEICEECAKINLAYIYKECDRLTDFDGYNSEYDGDAEWQALKDVERIKYFVISYMEEIFMTGKNFEIKALE